MPKTYEPEIIAGGGSSPFDDLMYRWIAARNSGFSDPAADHPDDIEDSCLAQYDTSALDEARSVCDMLLNTPIYSEDTRLVAFRDALTYTVQERAAEEVMVERLGGFARDLAFEHVENAASWVSAGLTDAVSVIEALKGIEDGDPEIWDHLPKRPNLSGEWADSMTPTMLAQTCLMMDGVVGGPVDSNIINAVADAYEQAVDERWEEEIVKQLEREIGTGMERIENLANCARNNISSDRKRAYQALDILIDEAHTS